VCYYSGNYRSAEAEPDSQCKVSNLANLEHRLSPQSPRPLLVGGLVGDVEVAKVWNRHSFTMCRITGHLAPGIIPGCFYNTAGTCTVRYGSMGGQEAPPLSYQLVVKLTYKVSQHFPNCIAADVRRDMQGTV